MAYTPTVWATGDVIPAEKLNNIENGIVGLGALEVNLSVSFDQIGNLEGPPTCSATCKDIYDAMSAGKRIILKVENDYQLASLGEVIYDDSDEEFYSVKFLISYSGGIYTLRFEEYDDISAFRGSNLVGAHIILCPNSNDELPYTASNLALKIENNKIAISNDTHTFFDELTYYTVENAVYTFKTSTGIVYTANSGSAYPTLKVS